MSKIAPGRRSKDCPTSICTVPGCETVYKQFTGRKTTMCNACQARDVALSVHHRQRCSEAIRARFADPEKRAAQLAACTAGIRAKMQSDPAFAELRRQQGRRVGLLGKGNQSRGRGDPRRSEASRKRAATMLAAWCPTDLIPEYYRLRRELGIKPPKCRAMIEEQIADRGRREAEQRRVECEAKYPHLGPRFSAQLARVAAGARVVARPVIPSAEPNQTLGGVSSGML